MWEQGRNIWLLSFQTTWPLAFTCGFSKAFYWLHVRRKWCYVQSSNWESYLFDKNNNKIVSCRIFVIQFKSLYTWNLNSSKRSGAVIYISMQKTSWKTYHIFGFRCEVKKINGDFLVTIFFIWRLKKRMSVASRHLHVAKKVNFGP